MRACLPSVGTLWARKNKGWNWPEVKRWGVELHDLGGPDRAAGGSAREQAGFTG